MKMTTKDMVGFIERVQSAKLSNIEDAKGAGVYAINLAISKIDEGLRTKDFAAFSVVADLVTVGYLDKLLISLSVVNMLPTQDKVLSVYQRVTRSLELRPAIDFADAALSSKGGKGVKAVIIEANMVELRQVHKLCVLLRQQKDAQAIATALRDLIECDDPKKKRKGGTVDIAFTNLFSGIGEELGAMASARTNYAISQLFAREETRNPATKRYIEKTLMPEMMMAFEGEESVPVIFELIKDELGVLRSSLMASISHLFDAPSLQGAAIEFGDVITDIDETGKSVAQLPLVVDGEDYDLLMDINFRNWSLRESIMLIPFNLQLIERDKGLMVADDDDDD
jgi:hypothetical protein